MSACAFELIKKNSYFMMSSLNLGYIIHQRVIYHHHTLEEELALDVQKHFKNYGMNHKSSKRLSFPSRAASHGESEETF